MRLADGGVRGKFARGYRDRSQPFVRGDVYAPVRCHRSAAHAFMKRPIQILCAATLLGGGSFFAASALDDRLQELLRRYPEADLNHDGKLSVDEFRQFKGKTSPGTKPSPAPSPTPTPTPAASEPAAKPRSAGQVEISITSAQPVPINPKIYGINCAEMFIFDLVQKPEYLSALGELQLNTFLFPGGSSYHHPTGTGGFNIKEEEIAQSKHGTSHRINKVGSPDFFLQFAGFMPSLKGHAVFIPNIPNGTVDELDWYLQKLAAAQVPVETVVLGMEVQLGAFRFESSAAYIEKIQAFIDLLKAKYPAVRIAAWSMPVGRRATVPESFRQWNRDVARVPGLAGFAQYGWSEFGGAALRGRKGGGSADAGNNSPEQRLRDYDAFVRDFPEKEIKAYAADWGADKKMFLLQWGTHADRNTVLEGLHSVNFLFFMTQYNAAHDNYFEVATWSVPLMSDLSSGKRKGAGSGPTYRQDIALWASYLYAKPLRYFFSGDKSLLPASVSGVEPDQAMEVVKAIAGVGPDGKKYVCILNRGPAVPLRQLTLDGKPIANDTVAQVESVSGETLSTNGASVKNLVGSQALGSISLGPYSVTTLILP